MENNQATYKRIIINFIINWWRFIIFIGFFIGCHVWMIFAYIYQWGMNPMDIGGLIFMSIIWISIYILIVRRLVKSNKLSSKTQKKLRKKSKNEF